MKKEQNKNLKNKKKENMAPISELVLRTLFVIIFTVGLGAISKNCKKIKSCYTLLPSVYSIAFARHW